MHRVTSNETIFRLDQPDIFSETRKIGGATGAVGAESGVSALLRWLSTSDHFQQLIEGLVDTRALAHFAFMIGTFLVLTKAAVESVRWR